MEKEEWDSGIGIMFKLACENTCLTPHKNHAQNFDTMEFCQMFHEILVKKNEFRRITLDPTWNNKTKQTPHIFMQNLPAHQIL